MRLLAELFHCPKLILYRSLPRNVLPVVQQKTGLLRGARKETSLGGVCFFVFTTSFTPELSQNERKLEIGRHKKRRMKETEVAGHLFRPPSIFCNGKSILIYNSFSSFVSTVIYSQTPSPNLTLHTILFSIFISFLRGTSIMPFF